MEALLTTWCRMKISLEVRRWKVMPTGMLLCLVQHPSVGDALLASTTDRCVLWLLKTVRHCDVPSLRTDRLFGSSSSYRIAAHWQTLNFGWRWSISSTEFLFIRWQHLTIVPALLLLRLLEVISLRSKLVSSVWLVPHSLGTRTAGDDISHTNIASPL